ncbi:hypothetical protein ACFQ1S_21600, partial [Kibdelosporangium lantanae]
VPHGFERVAGAACAMPVEAPITSEQAAAKTTVGLNFMNHFLLQGAYGSMPSNGGRTRGGEGTNEIKLRRLVRTRQ